MKRQPVPRSERCQWTPGCKRQIDLYLRRGKTRVGICWECWSRHCAVDPLAKAKVKA